MKSTRAPKKHASGGTAPTPEPEPRFQQLSDIALSGDDDNAACALADLAREFPTKN
jgi:hypothetical protein